MIQSYQTELVRLCFYHGYPCFPSYSLSHLQACFISEYKSLLAVMGFPQVIVQCLPPGISNTDWAGESVPVNLVYVAQEDVGNENKSSNLPQ